MLTMLCPCALRMCCVPAVLNCAFMLSLMGFLALHVSLVLANTTTIEAFEKTKAGSKWRYDMGRQRNIEQVRHMSSI